MPLEGLLALVERLRERIDVHGATLRGNEALTRSALIDPLLRELGWDTSDPHMVMPEYKLGNGRADYALLSNGSPMVILEAKSLESPLQNAVEQGVHYCLMQGTSYFSVTDGRRWEVYETHKPVPVEEKRVAFFRSEGAIGGRGMPAGIVAVEAQRDFRPRPPGGSSCRWVAE